MNIAYNYDHSKVIKRLMTEAICVFTTTPVEESDKNLISALSELSAILIMIILPFMKSF